MNKTAWFSLLINEETKAVIMGLFQPEDHSSASFMLSAILKNAATSLLIQELPNEKREHFLNLISSDDQEKLLDWLQKQPEEIKIALHERLDRTLLELQSQLVSR